MTPRVKGCYPCSRRRISCDRTEPQCRKCTRVGIECPGLGKSFRWKKPMQPNSAILTKRTRRTEAPVSSATTDDDSLSLIWPRALAPTAHPDQWAINYFAFDLSRWIYPTRSSSNEFKTLLVPFASTSSEVFAAVAAAAFHRLAYYGNQDFGVKAENYKALAIKGLLSNAQMMTDDRNSNQVQLTALAVIVIMVYDDMISAQNNFRQLIRVMKTLLLLVNPEVLKGDCLGQFLVEQIGLLLVLCLPYFDIMGKDKDIEHRVMQFLEKFASSDNRHRNASFLAFCLRQSAGIWVNNIKTPGTNVDAVLFDLKSRLERFDDIEDIDHFLTWVYFNCAAASTDSSLRLFYRGRLGEHARLIEFKNMPLMLTFLDRLWDDGQHWPLRLQNHNEYICA